ncbi:MAG TPA: regulatory iron-sulfur-containing complex subunit RicT [Gemmatimonadaceae bacterium]|nr:regulatory iron-sulfur-containing complex subunit RicT [Gemmatimonadaceae bacterium]
MTHLVEVAFKGNRKEFYLWDGEELPRPDSSVIVEADRGEDLGRVRSVGELAAKRCSGCAHGCGNEQPRLRMLRPASSDDERRAAELRTQDEEVRRKAMERVKAHGLVMKVSDAEWQWDRKKLTFYFTAEKRVDFRALVRDLASAFRTRIELKQIGVRDEAKRLSGIGRCGREYCSASWLPELRPVNLQVAKDQRLSLNPSQISGACGRLMCCLRYEHEFYVQSRKRFPKEGKILVTANGEEQVVSNDIFGDRVTLRNSEGDFRVVPLSELKAGMERRSGGAALPPRRLRAEAEQHSTSDPDVDEALPDDDDAPGSASARETTGQRPASLDDRASDDHASDDRRPRRTRGRRGGRRHRSTDADSASPSTPRNRGRRPDRGASESPNED